MNIEIIRKYLGVIRRAAALIEAELDDAGAMEELISNNVIKLSETKPQEIEFKSEVKPQEINEDRQKHIQDLLAIYNWPEAVPSFLTVTPTDKDQKNRATAVMDMVLDRSLEGLNFLDFGCGEGWTTQDAMRRGAKSAFGYDLKINEKWKNLYGPKFITNFSGVQPDFFDVVLLYDVLDHAVDPESIMDSIHKSMKKNGVLYVRCHPWTARHATHLYKQGINKAYFHMFLSWDEVRSIINDLPMFTRIEKNPIESYNWWFKNFKIVKERIITEPVNEFFENPDFKSLLAEEQKVTDIDAFLKLLQIQFVDYQLVPK